MSSGAGGFSGEMETEVSSPVGGSGARGGGDAVQKIPMGGVGQRVGMAGEGVRRWEPEIRW